MFHPTWQLMQTKESPRELARSTKTSTECNNLYNLLGTHKIKAFRNGRIWRIPKQTVKEYILEQARMNKG